MRESYNQRRRFVMHKLQGMGLPCFEPQGAFYVFPCIKEFGMSSEEFAEELLKEEKVAIVPGYPPHQYVFPCTYRLHV